jgi:hypothetical protein
MPLKKRPKPSGPKRVPRSPRLEKTVPKPVENAPVSLVAFDPSRTASLTTRPTTQDAMRAVVDRYCGPNGERIVQALAVLALGNQETRHTFFGEPVRVQARDRTQALSVLSDRRWGRPGQTLDFDPSDPLRLPVQIINVFAPRDDDAR